MVPEYRLFPPRNIPIMKSMHGKNVVWLCAKYAVDANLFRLESSILTRAINRNNVGGNIPGWDVPGRVDLEPYLIPTGSRTRKWGNLLICTT